MSGLLPVVSALQRAFRVNQYVSDVLNIAYFMLAAAHAHKWIIFRGSPVGWIKPHASGKSGSPARRELPILALDVVDDGAAGPGQQGWYNQPHALA